ncbi:hypothetical protein L208DRAFT_1406003 [Tricholoma matsutake]|nr:hypothetical protein L208DRAFT_1409586 [Tricholoma matsutake 945]KAF8227070.1 hypothetical protein L208DRAFT_1406003 [Tricholoma matsutake 945]
MRGKKIVSPDIYREMSPSRICPVYENASVRQPILEVLVNNSGTIRRPPYDRRSTIITKKAFTSASKILLHQFLIIRLGFANSICLGSTKAKC